MAKAKAKVKIRLLFVDGGAYHHEDVEIPASSMDAYERLIDCVREDESVLKTLYVDAGRLCGAWVIDA
jgi:hypothetical protein